VVIVGRPNVGKSTLFNRLAGGRRAITDDESGVTRDCVFARVDWSGREFTLVDTGGFLPRSTDAIEKAVRRQAERVLQEADLAILVCDGTAGLTDMDSDVASVLRRRSRPSMVVVNKLDAPEHGRFGAHEFYSLGLGDPIGVSAATGRCSGDLLDSIIEQCADPLIEPEGKSAEGNADLIRVVISGRPNVGKSTLVNHLVGEEVRIVHDSPGTTRDSADIRFTWSGRDLVLIDTAGLRRRARIDNQIEYYSTLRAGRSIANADVAVILLDAIEGPTVQDARIMAQVIEAGRGMVVALNKWDEVDPERRDVEAVTADLWGRFPFLVDFPVITISALTGKRVSKLLDSMLEVHKSYMTRIPTATLNACITAATTQVAPTGEGKEIRILYATQHGVAPPTFILFVNRPDLITDAYKRYLEKCLRREFGFEGTPMRLYLRRRKGRRG
jgi:GTP-binding protein